MKDKLLVAQRLFESWGKLNKYDNLRRRKIKMYFMECVIDDENILVSLNNILYLEPMYGYRQSGPEHVRIVLKGDKKIAVKGSYNEIKHKIGKVAGLIS